MSRNLHLLLTVVLALFTAKILTAQSEDTLLDPINKSENLIHNPVSIQNIFNKNYQTVIGRTMPGTHFSFGLTGNSPISFLNKNK